MIPAMIAQIFIPTAEPGTATNEVNAEIETQLLKLNNASVLHNLNTYMSFYAFLSLNHCFISSKK